ncbi:MAG TPA: Gfo/Idh/MocA family oxidoreductase [Oscillospiraceae bacterium]|nr:Gfo/Idh/MocA family oxidoreductase [Oscillospiraceae bacterium]
MKKLKIGIIGTGGIAGNHIESYLKNPNVELYAFCDINEERVKARGEKYGVTRLYTDKDEMLKLKELDAVSVTTWNSQHAPCTIAALNAGKHVICEKPMAMNAVEAQAMADAAKKNNKLLMIGFVRRFGNDCDILKDFVDSGYFGDIYYAKATYLRRNGNPGGWFADKSRSGGGPLIDLGVHVIDLARYLMGCPKPVSVYAATYQKLFDRPGVKDSVLYSASDVSKGEHICDVEDFASALIRFDNGAVIALETSFSLNIKDGVGDIQLMGTKAGARLDPTLEIFTEQNGFMCDIALKKPSALSFDGLFQKEIDHWVDCLLGKTECRAPAEAGVTLMKILDAAYESARTGHEVIIK